MRPTLCRHSVFALHRQIELNFERSETALRMASLIFGGFISSPIYQWRPCLMSLPEIYAKLPCFPWRRTPANRQSQLPTVACHKINILQFVSCEMRSGSTAPWTLRVLQVYTSCPNRGREPIPKAFPASRSNRNVSDCCHLYSTKQSFNPIGLCVATYPTKCPI